MGCIYLIQNRLNGKSYIGKTIRDVNQRWAEHAYSALEGFYWKRADV